jgi:superfamily II DNA helicase RecQ
MLPAIYHQTGVTLVFSPLLALIADQCAVLRELGIPCATLNSSIPATEKQKILEVLY